MSSQTHQSEAERRRESKEAYDHVVRIVEYQTGDTDSQLPAMTKRTTVLAVVGHGLQIGPDDASSKLRVACSNGDLFEWAFDVDRRDRPVTRVARTDAESLLDVLEWETAKEDPDRELVRRITAKLRGLDHGHFTRGGHRE